MAVGERQAETASAVFSADAPRRIQRGTRTTTRAGVAQTVIELLVLCRPHLGGLWLVTTPKDTPAPAHCDQCTTVNIVTSAARLFAMIRAVVDRYPALSTKIVALDKATWCALHAAL